MNAAARNLEIWRFASPLGQAFFYAPIFFLYWNSFLPVERVLQLEAAYYLTVVVLEVPSGYLSDRVGRVATLRLSSAFGVAAYALFFIGGSFEMFLAAQVALAVHFSFRSGTDAAWHYDLLEEQGLEEEYAERESRLARAGFWVRAICALIGGAIGSSSLGAPYGLSLGVAAIVFVLMMLSTELANSPDERAGTFASQMRGTFGRLRNPFLAWIFAYVILQTTLEHVPYEFAQPYLAAVMGDAGIEVSRTPIATGFLVAGVALVGGWAAGLAPMLHTRFGATGSLLALTLLQTAIIAILAAAIHPVIALLLLLRSVHPAIGHILVNAAVAPRVPRSERATYLSLHSLAGRAGYGAVLLSLGALASGAEVMTSAELRLLLGACAAMAGIGTLALLVFRRRAEGSAQLSD